MKKKIVTVTLTLPDGSRKFYRGSTKKEAEAKRDKDKVAMSHGIDICDDSTFQQIGDQWYQLFKVDNLHVRSLETIEGTLRRYVYPILGHRMVKDIRPADIAALMKSVSSMSKSTQRKVLQATKAICRFAVDNDLILKSPVLSSIKAGGADPEEVEALTDEQCRRLLDAISGTRASLFVKLLLYTGLRKGEALGLMWKDIDFDHCSLAVNRSIVYPVNNRAGEINTDLKTANAHRVIPITPDLLEALRAEKNKSKSVYVFSMKNGKFLSESSFRRMWDLIKYRSSGTSSGKTKLQRTIDFDVHPHQLRHTCITKWIEHGMGPEEAQYLAGHATPDITMNIYTHYRKKQRFAATAAKMAAISY